MLTCRCRCSSSTTRSDRIPPFSVSPSNASHHGPYKCSLPLGQTVLLLLTCRCRCSSSTTRSDKIPPFSVSPPSISLPGVQLSTGPCPSGQYNYRQTAGSRDSRARELCESRGGRPGLPSLIRLVYVDVKQHFIINNSGDNSVGRHRRCTLLNIFFTYRLYLYWLVTKRWPIARLAWLLVFLLLD